MFGFCSGPIQRLGNSLEDMMRGRQVGTRLVKDKLNTRYLQITQVEYKRKKILVHSTRGWVGDPGKQGMCMPPDIVDYYNLNLRISCSHCRKYSGKL